jgi:hypothetical protein
MAGFSFGKSRWDDLPAALGLRVEEGGVLAGPWAGGLRVEGTYDNEYQRRPGTQDEGDYIHYTKVSAVLDPPLMLDPEHFQRVVSPDLRAEVGRRLGPLGVAENWFGDREVSARWHHYEEHAERFRAAFDVLAWAAQTILARRAVDPPRWETGVASTWPPVARAWGLALEPRRGLAYGPVHGRRMAAQIHLDEGRLSTHVVVEAMLPPGVELSLAKQEGDGFWKRLFRGQDIEVGDPAFDAAFVIKGGPEQAVRAILGPSARRAVLGLLSAGAAIELKDGTLGVWAPDSSHEPATLDHLLRGALEVVEAMARPGS